MLSRGLPVRHHVVIYTHARLSDPLSSTHLQAELRLDPAEVGAATWLSRSMVAAIVGVSDGDSGCEPSQLIHDEFPDTIQLVSSLFLSVT